MDSEDEEDVCRICRNPGDSDNPLRYPCACSGSIKFVHQSCLLQWLNHTNTLRCEVCKNPFSFSQVYAENTPTRLPFHEFVAAIAMRTYRALRFFLRLSFVLSVWFLAVPFVTFWMWRLAFVRSFGEARSLFLSHISATVILADCLCGSLLSYTVVCISVGAIAYFRELRGQEEREDERGGNGAAGEANRNLAGEGNGEDARDPGAGEGNGEDAGGPGAGAGQIVIRINIQLDEVVGMQGPVFRLVENALFVLACNLIFLSILIFVPFTLGRVVLNLVSWLFTAARVPALTATSITLKSALSSVSNMTNQGQENGLLGPLSELLKRSVAGSSKLSGVVTLTVGYMFIVFLVSLYLGISSIPRKFRAALRLAIRVAYFVVIHLGVLPLICGWWLDVCSVMMFGKTMSHWFLSISLVHWVVGIMYMLQISIFVSLLQKVLRPGVLYFLPDPADPNDNPFRDLIDDPVHKHARRVLLLVAMHGSLIVMLVFLPVKLAIRMAPSIFPLDISVSDPYTEIPAGMLLFQICIPYIMEQFRLGTTIKSLLRCWFTGVSWALGLTDFLLPRPEENIGRDNQNGEPGRQNRAQVMQVGGPDRAMVALPANTSEEYEDDEEQSEIEYKFVLRIILLLLVAWVTLLLFNSALLVVLVSLGRVLFSAIPLLPITHGIKSNDLYAFFIGTYAFWTTVSGAWYLIEHVKSKRTSVLLNQVWKWCGIVFKSSVPLAIWVFIIPVLIGLLFELLVIVPMRVPVDESPVFLLYQDWVFGHIFLKIWTRLVMMDIMLPLVGDNWRARFERVREDGFSRLQGLWVLREILFPVVTKLLTVLCVPYVLARGVFPMLGYPLFMNSAVYRFAWISSLSVSVFFFCAKRCLVWFRKLQKAIRDDRYVVGRRLHNFGEAALD